MKYAVTRWLHEHGFCNRYKSSFLSETFTELKNELEKLFPPPVDLTAKLKDINSKFSNHDYSLLHLACLHYNLNKVEGLIARGADPNIQDKYGDSPIMIAIRKNNIEIVKLLFKAGANIYLKNIDGDTSIQIAKNHNAKDIVDLLDQYESVNAITHSSKIKNSDCIAEKISKLFHAYAHPPLFTLHWRSHQKLADEIAVTLKNNSTWSGEECKEYILQATQNLPVKEFGSFNGLIDKANQMILAENKITAEIQVLSPFINK